MFFNKKPGNTDDFPKVKEVITNAVYDLKAVNPSKEPAIDIRAPEEVFEIMEAKGTEVKAALVRLKRDAS